MIRMNGDAVLPRAGSFPYGERLLISGDRIAAEPLPTGAYQYRRPAGLLWSAFD